MIENNLNEELIVNDEVLKEDNVLNNEVVESKNTEDKKEDSPIIETLYNTTVFTPIVSDGIFEEEVLELDEMCISFYSQACPFFPKVLTGL